MEQAVRFLVITNGTFVNFEDPEQALRYDKTVRNMNLHTFRELRTLLIKLIKRTFRDKAEKLFNYEVLERWELSQ